MNSAQFCLAFVLLGFIQTSLAGEVGAHSREPIGGEVGQINIDAEKKCFVSPANNDLVEIEVDCGAEAEFVLDSFRFKMKERRYPNRDDVWSTSLKMNDGAFSDESKLLKAPPVTQSACGSSGSLAERLRDCASKSASEKDRRSEICFISEFYKVQKLFDCRLKRFMKNLGFAQTSEWRLVTCFYDNASAKRCKQIWLHVDSAKLFTEFSESSESSLLELISPRIYSCRSYEGPESVSSRMEIEFRPLSCEEVQGQYFSLGLKELSNFRDTLSRDQKISNKSWCLGPRAPVIFDTIERDLLPDFDLAFTDLKRICVSEVRMNFPLEP